MRRCEGAINPGENAECLEPAGRSNVFVLTSARCKCCNPARVLLGTLLHLLQPRVPVLYTTVPIAVLPCHVPQTNGVWNASPDQLAALYLGR